jgi:hypothetical protein
MACKTVLAGADKLPNKLNILIDHVMELFAAFKR